MNVNQFSRHIGNIDEQLVQQSENIHNYAHRHRVTILWRMVSLASVIALMFCSFTVGASVMGADKHETITLDGIGLTLILPDDWKGNYGVEVNEDGTGCAVYVKSVHESTGDWAGQGYLFWVVRAYNEPMTPTEVDEVSPVAFQYLFSTTDGTYILAYASDVQWDTSDANQEQIYLSMSSQISQIHFLLKDIL